MLKNLNTARPFFRTVSAYVLLFRDEAGDWCVDAAVTELGRAVTCFLSPFDAIIEAAHLARNGRSYRVMPASDVAQHLFLDSDKKELLVAFTSDGLGVTNGF